MNDFEWVDGFLDRVLDSWRVHSDTPSGLFDPYLDRQWRHNVDAPRTLVSQCRLIYNFARAFERNGDQAFADLAHRGIGALESCFRDASDQGWIWACRGDGEPADDTYDAYGHAFVILALATSAAAFQDDRYRDRALQTWEFMQRRFGDEHGGLIWHIASDGRVVDEVRSQNPLMHTFEALLTLAPLDDRSVVRQDAFKVWEFIKERLLGPGRLPEWYDPMWQPVVTGERAVIDVGHAFEWAFLLSEAQVLFPEEDLLEPGRQFLTFGMHVGYDRDEGGIFSPVSFDGSLPSRRKGWWEQCEAIRTMQRYVNRHGAAEIAAPLAQSIAFVRQHFVDEEFGGWYLNPPGMGGETSLDKGNAYKLDYHVVNMCRELLAT